jgi:hypothetical protein
LPGADGAPGLPGADGAPGIDGAPQDAAGITALGFVAGAHTTKYTDAEAVTAVGAHTVDTDTHLDAAGVTALGFVAGAHTTKYTDAEAVTAVGAHTVDQDVAAVLTKGNNAGANSLVNVSQIGIGTATPNSSAAVEISSTTGSFLLSRMTTTQRDALTPAAGMMIYNTDDNKFQGYTSTSNSVANSSEGGTGSYVLDDGVMMQDYPAQSFQPAASVSLNTVSFWVEQLFNGFLSGDVTVNVYQGVPNTPVTLLHTSNITVNSLGKNSVDIPSLPSITSGTDYYFEIIPTAPFPMGFFTVTRSATGSGPYASGSLWTRMMGSYMFLGDDLKFEIKGSSGSDLWIDLH